MRRRAHRFRVHGAILGIVPRLLLLALVAAGAVILIPYALWQGIAVTAAAVALVVPRTLAAWLAAACLPLGLALDEPSPARTALAILLVHAVHVLGALSLTIPLTSRVALRALRPSAIRFAVVQIIAQPLALGAWLLSARIGTSFSWLAPVAAAILFLGVVVARRALQRADAPIRKRSATAPQDSAKNAV